MYTGTILDIFNIGGSEFALIFVVVLLLFGGKKLPELARGLGKGIREFKDASEDVKREIHRNINAAGLDNDLLLEQANVNQRHHPVTDEIIAIDTPQTAEKVATTEETLSVKKPRKKKITTT